MLCTKLFLILVIYDDNFRNIFPLLECYFILSKYIIHHLIASPHHLIASPHVEWRDAEMWKYNNFCGLFLLCIFLIRASPLSTLANAVLPSSSYSASQVLDQREGD